MSFEGQLIVPSVNTSFTNLNFITNAVTGTVGESKYLYVPGAANHNVVGQYVGAPATPYCIIANLANNQGDYVSSSYVDEKIMFGIGFYDGTKLVVMTANYSSTVTMSLAVGEYATVSSTPTSVFGQSFATGHPSGMLQWFQIRDDGTNIYFYIAFDGGESQPLHWVKLYSQARTSYLANVNNVGWFCDSNGSASGNPTYLTLNSWQTVAL